MLSGYEHFAFCSRTGGHGLPLPLQPFAAKHASALMIICVIALMALASGACLPCRHHGRAKHAVNRTGPSRSARLMFVLCRISSRGETVIDTIYRGQPVWSCPVSGPFVSGYGESGILFVHGCRRSQIEGYTVAGFITLVPLPEPEPEPEPLRGQPDEQGFSGKLPGTACASACQVPRLALRRPTRG